MLLRFFCGIFVLILFLPTLQYRFNIVPRVNLMGVEESAPRPQWSMSNWLDGTYQDQYAKRRSSMLGLRGYFVKTYNQLHYSIFHRVVSTSGTSVIIGKENWLYEKAYIEKYNLPAKDDGTRIEVQAKWLRILQDHLERMGVAFVFVIAPSKAEVYPEYIPDDLLNPPLAQGAETDYQQARDAFLRHGVNFVDSHVLFNHEKKAKDYQLFGPSGTHWNKYGAFLVWKEIDAMVKGQLRNPLQFPLLEGVEKKPSEEVDADLGSLLNLWDTTLSAPVTDYPVFKARDNKEDENKKPSILIVGDSFLFTLIDIVKRANLATEVDAWYYFKRHFKYPAKDGQLMNLTAAIETVIDRNNVDWQEELFEKDLVILAATEYWLPNVGFGFVESALEAIQKDLEVKKD